MEKLEFRMLKADEIDCRVGATTDKGCSLLMYKDARVDMRLLDEVVGAMNWKREHQLINDNLFCTVSIKDPETGEWVSKQDVGVESNTEKEKGQASDAFKRACFNWGIGRELYTCPFVWINLGENEYKDGKVSYLVIIDENGKERFRFGKSAAYDEALKLALNDVKATTDIKALEALYFGYKEKFGNDAKFLDALKTRKAELSKAA